MTTDANAAPGDGGGRSRPLSTASLRSARFDQARRGYDRDQVHALLARVADHIDDTEAECRRLRDTVARLEQRNARSPRSEDAEDEARMLVSMRAVALLTRAQQSADNAVAEAEAYARDLVTTAREQYRDILHRAHETAARSSRDVAAVGSHDPVPEIEYVRTYARVAQVQLRSVLDALTAEVDKLDRIPTPEQSPQQPSLVWQAPGGPAQLNSGTSAYTSRA